MDYLGVSLMSLVTYLFISSIFFWVSYVSTEGSKLVTYKTTASTFDIPKYKSKNENVYVQGIAAPPQTSIAIKLASPIEYNYSPGYHNIPIDSNCAFTVALPADGSITDPAGLLAAMGTVTAGAQAVISINFNYSLIAKPDGSAKRSKYMNGIIRGANKFTPAVI